MNGVPVESRTTDSKLMNTINNSQRIIIGSHPGSPVSFIESPKITLENAASMTPEQWTTAQDDAVAKALNITPKEAASLTKEQYEAAIVKGVDIEELSNSYHCSNVTMIYRYMRREINE